MEILIITGMSGAGKSSCLNVVEDMGYYCMDNFPPQLMANFVELTKSSTAPIDKVAMVIDIRGGTMFNSLLSAIEYLRDLDLTVKMLFLDANNSVLVRRYKELRRPHPLAQNQSIESGIKREREIMEPIQKKSDYYIDTSKLNIWEFKKIVNKFLNKENEKDIVINVTSFGFKHGILQDADLVFDVRFIPNPFYIESLKDKTGLDIDVKSFVLSYDISNRFIEDFLNMVNALIPHYIGQGKSSLTIGIGCTGGKHRSVVITDEIGKKLEESNRIVYTNHRDKNFWDV